MTRAASKPFHRFATALLLGAGSGAVFLGAGGRFVMHVFALTTGRSTGFTLRASLTVMVAGAVAGALGGALLAVTERFMPQRLWLRGVLFAALCYVVAIPGFRPPRPLVFALFAPAFLLYGLALELAWERLVPSRPLKGA